MVGRSVVLSDGGLASLVAAAAEVEGALATGDSSAPMPALVEWPGLDRAGSASVRRQAEALGLMVRELPETSAIESAGGREAAALLQAAYLAMASGCGRVVWPVQFTTASPEGDCDLEREAIAVDRALLVSRLATLDAGCFGLPELRVETPLVGMTDHQVAELALDLGVPVECCAWWEAGRRAERERWTSALSAAGWIPSEPTPRPVTRAGDV
ncbi:MAG: hypothetical protein KIS87_10900 [Phycisphaeraceae bacterium]|nr:hypothetical protein [Phycisphaeraceae bacterium]